jgi:SAM-dependent methyltransferase
MPEFKNIDEEAWKAKVRRYVKSYSRQNYGKEWERPFWPPFWHVARELWRDKSINGIGMRWLFRQWQSEIQGIVLEAPCGKPTSRIPFSNHRVDMYVGVDINEEHLPTVVADLDKSFPFQDGVANAVIIANSLYLFPNPQKILVEIKRVLHPGGVVMLVVPLVWQYYPDPKDYWRFTGEGLEYVLEQAGFEDITIVPIGGRWTAAAILVSPFFHPGRIVRPLVNILCVLLDRFVRWAFPFVALTPLSYCAKARKA